MSHPLANLIPVSNAIDIPSIRGLAATAMMELAYSESSSFVGAFCRGNASYDMPSWATRIAAYDRDEFHDNTPGKKKHFSDVIDSLADDGAGRACPHHRYALEQWEAAGRPGPEPYTTQQDYGSCVDASTTELLTGLIGWRVNQGTFGEKYHRAAAWYFYADRGYCSDGWNCFSLAKVALRVGLAFRQPYDLPGGKVDFTNDDENERIVARQWCRNGIPSWISSHTSTNHPFEDGAITEFDGDVNAMRSLIANGGGFNTGGTNTSGGSKPFTIGRVGGHEQSCSSCDDSDEFRKWCKDIIGVTPRTNDFPVIMHQTWGPGFSGECADKYWPPWWGKKPQGAWVWWASDILKYFGGDIVAFLPRFKGVPGVPVPSPPGPGPTPPPSPTPGQMIPVTFHEPVPAGRYILFPESPG